MAPRVRYRPLAVLALAASGGLLLLLGLLLHWFNYPISGPPTAELPFAVVGREAPATIPFKLLCVSAVVTAVVRARRTPGPDAARGIAARVSAALFCALLFFPHAVMVWCPATSARAQWLESQHAQLTQHTGDDFTLSEVKRFGWKSRVSPVDMLNEVSTMSVPALSPMAIPFGGLRPMFEWFGYSEAFCEFASMGWGLSLLGSFLVLLASCRAGDRLDYEALGGGARIGSMVIALAAAASLTVAAAAALEIDRARAAVEEGQPTLALARLETASRLLPLLRESADVALQRGVLEARLGERTPEARFYRAKVAQSEGLLDEAEETFGSLLASEPDGPIRRESGRGVLRRGIRKLNAGEVASAIHSLEAVLDADAASLKANYVLQLAYLHAARFDSLRAATRTMRRTYLFFSSDLRLPIMATAQENVAYASYLENDPMRAHTVWATLCDAKYLAKPWW
jgi:tetratricopeptide (TPR) repeat protein